MNCKPGDLAWIVRCFHTTEILGHIVEVLGPYQGDTYQGRRGAWEVRYPDGRPILTTYLPSGRKSLEPTRPINDICLRPIRPGDLHETEDERKEVTA